MERKIKQAKTREEFKKANEDLKVYMAELKRKEKEEEKKIEIYAKKKEILEK